MSLEQSIFDIAFPCDGFYRESNEDHFKPCVVMGMFQEGSAQLPNSTLKMVWLVLVPEYKDTGDHLIPKKIWKIDNVRFAFQPSPTT